MAEFGFASAILKSKVGAMDDVARTLAAAGREAGSAATPLEQFTGHVDSARRLFDITLDDAIAIAAYPPALEDAAGGLRGLIGHLDAAYLLPVRHRAMGAASSARAAAERVLAHFDEAERVGVTAAIATPKMDSPLFQDLWKLRLNLDEAFDGAGAAKVMNDWR